MKAMFHARRAVNAQDNVTRRAQIVELAARVAEWPVAKPVAALAGALSRQPVKYRNGKLVLASAKEQKQIVQAVARIIGR